MPKRNVNIFLTVLTGGAVPASEEEDVMLSATVNLTNAQIKALPSTPVEIIAAPGANKSLFFFAALLHHAAWTQYSGLDATYSAMLFLSGDTVLQASVGMKTGGFLNNGGESLLHASAGTVIGSGDYLGDTFGMLGSPNQSFVLTMDNNGDETDLGSGNAANTLAVTVFYAVVDL